jgi:hypothetical protein
MFALAAWEWTPAEKPMTRIDATAMNRLCQWIAGDDADKYRRLGPRGGFALAWE